MNEGMAWVEGKQDVKKGTWAWGSFDHLEAG